MYSIFVELLQRDGVSTYQVSKATGIAQSVFSSWKNGISKPKADKLKKIADYFGVSTDYLLGRGEKAPAPEEPEQEQDEVNMEFADRVSRLSDAGREALSHYLDLLLKTVCSSISATVCHTDRISRISEGKARPSARS